MSTYWFKANLIQLTALICAISSSCTKQENMQMPPPTVVVAPIKAEKVSPSVNFVGQAVSRERVKLRARVTGFLIKKGFEDGDYVKKGQLLFEIEQSQYKAEVKAAKALLLQSEAVLKNAEIEFNRNRTLIQKNAVARTDYDKAVMDKEKGIADTMAAKAKLEAAELNLSYTDIYAPFDGRVGLAKYDVGNLVGPTSEPLAEITMLDPILIEFSVSETLLVSALMEKVAEENSSAIGIYKKLQAQKVILKIILSNGVEYKCQGEINFVDNNVNQLTGTIVLRALFPNPEHIIIPGAYVKVKISQVFNGKTILVPQKAVQESQAGKYVYLIDKNKKVESRIITTIQEYEQCYMVSDGVNEGDLVIVEGLQKVRPGMLVNPISEKENQLKN